MDQDVFACSRVVMNGDVPIMVWQAGDPVRTPIFLLHGVTSGAFSWNAVVPVLAREFFVQAIDLRGHGQSGHPRRGYRQEDYASDVQSVLEDTGVAHPLIAGHSLGGRVTLAWADRHPDAAAALVLEDPPLSQPPWVEDDFRATIALKRLPFGELLGAIRRKYPDLADDDVRRRAERLAAVASGVFADGLAELGDRRSEDWIARHAGIRSPILVIRGDPDAGGIVPDADAERFVATLLAARVAQIPGGPHTLHRDRADVFLALALPFLRERDAAANARA